jgi:L-ribulokinase
MSPGTETAYRPDPARAERYAARYAEYRALGSFVERELARPQETGEGP